MAIPKIDKQNVLDALRQIDEDKIPDSNNSTIYDLVYEGKKYPPKYVVAVADKIANGSSTSNFISVEAVKCLEQLGFTVERKKYVLTITSDQVTSTDPRFTMDDLTLGNNYEPESVYFKRSDGTRSKREHRKSEKKISNKTMPRLACQIFQQEIQNLSNDEKLNFPVCQYRKGGGIIRGIFPDVQTFHKNRNRKSLEHVEYDCGNGEKLVFYSWNIFTTIIFVQECLKRFGASGDEFVLTYMEKEDKTGDKLSEDREAAITEENMGYKNAYSTILLSAKNVIFRGAPGTGKTYLAKQIAADIISGGKTDTFSDLADDQKKQVEFVQFHPSYDYTDFVEGLRPIINDDGSMGFELQDGIFKKFVNKAKKNQESSQKTEDTIKKELSAQEAMSKFFSNIDFGVQTFKTVTKNTFTITNVDDKYIYISIPENAIVKQLKLNLDEVRKMLESENKFDKIKDVTMFFGKEYATQGYSYDYAIFKEIIKVKESNVEVKREIEKKYVFIIDEINRGEISKIFGELFFSIDPGYRGKSGKISTQYSNLHSNSDEEFYIPDNVYIIGCASSAFEILTGESPVLTKPSRQSVSSLGAEIVRQGSSVGRRAQEPQCESVKLLSPVSHIE